MLSHLKSLLQSSIRVFGYEFTRMRTPRTRWGWLRHHNITTVLDIGANEGQFAEEITRVLPEVQLYAFEPLRESFLRLQERFAGRDHIRVFNIAIGDDDGVGTIHKNSFSPSSSLLDMTRVHRDAFPFTRDSLPEAILIRKLTTVLSPLEVKPPVLVKVDVQGYEDRVLRGMGSLLNTAHVAIIETSFVELYDGQVLFDSIYQYMLSSGFEFAGCTDVVQDPRHGQVLQADAIFVRNVSGGGKSV